MKSKKVEPQKSQLNPDLVGQETSPRHPLWESEAQLVQTIVRHWKQYRPDLYRQAEKKGSLYRLARADAQRTLQMAGNLMASGVEPATAWDEAMREVALSIE
jgi:hypothetical protein